MAKGSPSSSLAAAEATASGPPVFIDTNLETHLALVVRPDDTVADFKRKASVEHALCFPDIGEISVTTMKVRRRELLYHLSDSMLVWTAFMGIKGTWFLQMDVSPTSPVVKDQMRTAVNISTVNCEQVEKRYRLVQTEPDDNNIAGGGVSRKEYGVTTGPLQEENLIQSEPSSVPDMSSLPHVIGKNQTPNFHAPSTDQHLDAEKHVEVSRNVVSRGKEFCDGSENIVEPAPHMTVYEGDGVVASDVQHKIDMLIYQMEDDVIDKVPANDHDEGNDKDTSVAAAKKEKSRKRNKELESDHLLNMSKPSSRKKRHKQEKDSSFMDNVEDPSNKVGSETVLPEINSEDKIKGKPAVLGELCSGLLNSDSSLPQNPVDGKKKRRRRKQSSEYNNETDAAVTFVTSDSREKLRPTTGLSDQRSNENGSTLGKGVINENPERSLRDNAKDPVANPAMEFLSKNATENVTQGNPVEVGSEVPLKAIKKNSHQSRKKQAKNGVPSYESSEYEIVHSPGKQVTEENTREALANGHKSPATEANGKIILEEELGLRNATEYAPEVPSTVDDRSSQNSRKKSSKAESSKHKSNKVVNNRKTLGKESDAADVLGEAAVVGNPGRVDSGVPLTTNNRSPCSNKSRPSRIKLSDGSEHSSSHSFGKLAAEVHPNESLANDHLELNKELDAASILEETAAFKRSVEPSIELDEVNTVIKVTSCTKKKTVKTKLFHRKSDKNDGIHSLVDRSTPEKMEGALGNSNIDSCYSKSGIPPEEAAQIKALRKLVQVDSAGLSGHTSSKYETLHSSERPLSQDNPKEELGNVHRKFLRELSAEVPPEDLPDTASPRDHAEYSQVGKYADHPKCDNEKVNFKDFFVPKTTQHGVAIAEDGDTIMEADTTETHNEKPIRNVTKSRTCSRDNPSELAKSSDGHNQPKRKTQGVDSGYHNLADLVEEPALKQKRKSQKQKTDKRRGKPDMALGEASPALGSPKTSQDHQIYPSSLNDLNNPEQHPSRKISSDALKTSAQQQTRGSADTNAKEMNAVPAASSDSTEEDTPYAKKRYRVAVRKVPQNRFQKVDKSDREGVLSNPPDNIFGHVMSANSEDELETTNRKATSRSVSNNSTTSSDSEGDLEETQVIRGPRDKKYMETLGSRTSDAYGVNDKEASGDDTVLSQSLKAARKGMPLGMLIRNSISYKKAKLSASQSQNDDTESQPGDIVLETQPDSL